MQLRQDYDAGLIQDSVPTREDEVDGAWGAWPATWSHVEGGVESSGRLHSMLMEGL